MPEDEEGSFTFRSEDDIKYKHKPIMIFGRDVMTIPCFRKSIMCGIYVGVVGGLGTFLFTSKTLFSTHMAFASLWFGVFAYWIPCRYKYESTKLMFEAAKQQHKARKAKEKEEEMLSDS